MPTVFRSGPYRIYFFSHEPNEPPHVHVDRNGCSVKFWLAPVRLVRNVGFPRHEMRRIEVMVRACERVLLEAWNDYFGA